MSVLTDSKRSRSTNLPDADDGRALTNNQPVSEQKLTWCANSSVPRETDVGATRAHRQQPLLTSPHHRTTGKDSQSENNLISVHVMTTAGYWYSEKWNQLEHVRTPFFFLTVIRSSRSNDAITKVFAFHPPLTRFTWYCLLLGFVLRNQILSLRNWLAMYGMTFFIFILFPVRKSPRSFVAKFGSKIVRS